MNCLCFKKLTQNSLALDILRPVCAPLNLNKKQYWLNAYTYNANRFTLYTLISMLVKQLTIIKIDNVVKS